MVCFLATSLLSCSSGFAQDGLWVAHGTSWFWLKLCQLSPTPSYNPFNNPKECCYRNLLLLVKSGVGYFGKTTAMLLTAAAGV